MQSSAANEAGGASSVSLAVPYQPTMTDAEKIAAIGAHIGARKKLADFRPTIAGLKPAQRRTLIDEALRMLEQIYAHLPLKRALHANDPIQSLRLLRLREPSLDEREFQSALLGIFLGLRDLHTNYYLPKGYADMVAFLPFRVEEFYEPGGIEKRGVKQTRKYVVSWVSPLNPFATLKEGRVVTHWNGSPIDLAVARNGEREAGSNADARRAQGVEAMTLRWLATSLPPDEDWVNLTYTDGVTTWESRFDWEVTDTSDRIALPPKWFGENDVSPPLGRDLKRLFLDRARKLVFDPQAVAVEQEAKAHVKTAAARRQPEPPRASTSVFPDVFPWFGEVNVPGLGPFGYVRLKSFETSIPAVDPVGQIVQEFARILTTLPTTGLILDVRGNGGGYINIGERILQMLTPWPITPEPFQFLATPLTLAIAGEPKNFSAEWKETIEQGMETGASHSQGFPLTAPADCNDIGQLYQGPVALVTDALCYSTTDIFSAGFQDHEIGPVIGCHSSTGAGGATVWDYDDDLRKLVLKPDNPFEKLPAGAGMRVAALRSTRVGAKSGVPLEEYGVAPDLRYYPTRNDVAYYNADLIAAAAAILAEKPRHSLIVSHVGPPPVQQLTANSTNIDRIDLYWNDRPIVSQNVADGTSSLALPAPIPSGMVIAAYGYRRDELVVSTRIFT